MPRGIVRATDCPVELTMRLIGGKWKLLIVWELMTSTVLRNGELARRLPGITGKMLVQQLRELEEDGLVERTSYSVVPPRVEYRLSELGASLGSVMDSMCAWGETWKERNLTGRDAALPSAKERVLVAPEP